jgi:hypothetical protein
MSPATRSGNDRFRSLLVRDLDLRCAWGWIVVVLESKRDSFPFGRAGIVFDRAIVGEPEPAEETSEAGDDAATGRLLCRRLGFIKGAVEIAMASIQRAAARAERQHQAENDRGAQASQHSITPKRGRMVLKDQPACKIERVAQKTSPGLPPGARLRTSETC